MHNYGELNAFLYRLGEFSNGAYGHISGPVHFLLISLMIISFTLSMLFAALSHNHNIIGTLIAKALLFGFIAFVIGDWQHLTSIIFSSVMMLGVMASGSAMSSVQMQDPGGIAAVGSQLSDCMWQWVSQLSGPIGFFDNFSVIVPLALSALAIQFAFFIMAVMVFLALIQMQILAIAAFVLLPFAVFEKTSWLADHAFRFVAAAAVKILIMALVMSWAVTMIQPDAAAGTCASQPPDLLYAYVTELAAFVLLALLWSLPALASSLMFGGGPIGLHGMGMAMAGGLAAGVRLAAPGIGRAMSSTVSAGAQITRKALRLPPP